MTTIYKLRHRDPSERKHYIGSTGDLDARLCRHANASERPPHSQPVHRYIMQHGGWGAWVCEPIEHIADKPGTVEARQREQWHINAAGSDALNAIRAYVTPEVYAVEHEAWQRAHSPCDCGKKITNRNIARHARTSQAHRDIIFAQKLEAFILS